MSTSYWMIEGIGLNTDQIYLHLNKEKAVLLLIEQLEHETEIVAELGRLLWSGDLSGFDIDDYLYGSPFDNFADMLTYCDDTDTITYGDDGDGGHYFFYPPSMPWEMQDNEPQSIREVHNRIIKAVQKITDLDASEIDGMIDDELHVVGFG